MIKYKEILIIFKSSFEYRIKVNAKINSCTDFDIISYNIFLVQFLIYSGWSKKQNYIKINY